MSNRQDPVIEANGDGKELFDAPALFYLTHAEVIRRWSELSRVARSATSEFLETVGQALADEMNPDLWEMSAEDTGQGYRHFLWCPPGTATVTDETPAIALCFGWKSTKVRITPHTYTPFVGVRVPRGGAHELVRNAFLGSGEPDVRALSTSNGYARSAIWPIWKQVTGPEHWWSDLDGYREKVRTEFGTCVELFGPAVRAVANEVASL